MSCAKAMLATSAGQACFKVPWAIHSFYFVYRKCIGSGGRNSALNPLNGTVAQLDAPLGLYGVELCCVPLLGQENCRGTCRRFGTW